MGGKEFGSGLRRAESTAGVTEGASAPFSFWAFEASYLSSRAEGRGLPSALFNGSGSGESLINDPAVRYNIITG